MRWWIIGLLALSVVAGSTPAWAWWDFAKWGMTEQQVVAASKGRAQPCTQNDHGPCSRLMTPGSNQVVAVPRLAIENITIAGQTASVAFIFDEAQRLRMTRITFPQTQYRKILDTLIGTYGPPADQRGGAFANSTWRDASKGTLIKAVDILGKDVVVVYEAVKSGL